MQNYLKGLLTIVLNGCFYAIVVAQSGITTSGGDASSESGFVSYSLGQVVYQSIETNSGLLSQGVQQSFGDFVLQIAPSHDSSVLASLFPNPGSSNLNIIWDGPAPEGAEAHFYNAQGKLIMQQKLASSQSNFSVENLAQGIYFIKITIDETVHQSLKFIKNS